MRPLIKPSISTIRLATRVAPYPIDQSKSPFNGVHFFVEANLLFDVKKLYVFCLGDVAENSFEVYTQILLGT
jgi:hypothetical protein